MNPKIPENTMNAKHFSCSYKLQCDVVFTGKLELVICQNVSGGKKFNFPVLLVSANLCDK